MAQHVHLSPVPSISYEWGLTMGLDIAGQLEYSNRIRHVQIPFHYLGKKHGLGAVLAHELTHVVLFSQGLVLSDISENEMLTDLAAVYIGFGKLMLNGLFVPANGPGTKATLLGYLPFDLIVYSYQTVNKMRNIDVDTATSSLLPAVRERLATSG